MLLFGDLSHLKAQRKAEKTLKDIKKILPKLSEVGGSSIFDTEKYVSELQDRVKKIEDLKAAHHKADVGEFGVRAYNRLAAVDARDKLVGRDKIIGVDIDLYRKRQVGAIEAANSLLGDVKAHIAENKRIIRSQKISKIINMPKTALVAVGDTISGTLSHGKTQRLAKKSLKHINKTIDALSKLDNGSEYQGILEKHARKLESLRRDHRSTVDKFGVQGRNAFVSVQAQTGLHETVQETDSLLKGAKKHIAENKKSIFSKIGKIFSNVSKPKQVEHIGGEVSGGGFLGKVAIAATATAGAIAAVSVAAAWLGGKRKEETKQARSDISPINTASMGANTLMGFEPVAGERAAQIMARRGGAMGIDTSNPAMMLPYDVIH